MCDCITKVTEQLAEHNTRLCVGFALGNNTVTARVLLKTAKLDPSSRKPMTAVSAMFCPFCGEKQVQEGKPAQAVQQLLDTAEARHA